MPALNRRVRRLESEFENLLGTRLQEMIRGMTRDECCALAEPLEQRAARMKPTDECRKELTPKEQERAYLAVQAWLDTYRSRRARKMRSTTDG